MAVDASGQAHVAAHRLINEFASIGDKHGTQGCGDGCAGQFLISYTVPERWFPRERLPQLHDRLVAFFQAILPDSPLEVFP
jgi:hypothetical protein